MEKEMSTYHLVYFNMRGRGEPIRWILLAAEVDFSEEIINVFSDWKDRKEDYDWGNVPVLMVDGNQLHQTTVISRYLGEAHDMISKDLWTVTRQQELVEGVHDITYILSDLFIARLRQDVAQQTNMYNKAKGRLPIIFMNVERAITEEGWIYSDEMTWVDVFVAAYFDLFNLYYPGIIDNYPLCQELVTKVTSIPKIAKRIEERPDWSDFETPVNMNPEEE
ncbi:hematopoietic prostaglandin D synthase-like isoform X2 [Macrobrachium rosenbergii]|uniref:hematopoietic prostaglandin D synthase-like isoform X2 n=1 Tax=Macrobrachium rosenbergii TaxID=79674 RepID=UPI0034D60814